MSAGSKSKPCHLTYSVVIWLDGCDDRELLAKLTKTGLSKVKSLTGRLFASCLGPRHSHRIRTPKGNDEVLDIVLYTFEDPVVAVSYVLETAKRATRYNLDFKDISNNFRKGLDRQLYNAVKWAGTILEGTRTGDNSRHLHADLVGIKLFQPVQTFLCIGYYPYIVMPTPIQRDPVLQRLECNSLIEDLKGMMTPKK